MEARVSSGLQLPNWVSTEKIARKPAGSLQLFRKYGGQRLYHMPVTRCARVKERFHGFMTLKVSCVSENHKASVLESESSPAFLDESEIIKSKAEEVEPNLDGRSLYLVGMMGSGKTTVGKVLSEALRYSFLDCDALIEDGVGGRTVADIFKIHGESFFRDNETEVLKKLSSMHQLVVSTGGGAVVRLVNWRHMRKGISIWLDVPLEALARRIVAVGTGSRPLLNHGDGDPYTKTMKRLSTLFKQRGEAYANADVRVSLENMAAKLGYEDVSDISPTAIAIEALIQIEHFLTE
ncbi:shikimate kinase, chloroplastic-like [Salvia splendens]|uniref:shikimate kinase, chloroplastic-like n=1 Tax=Salvia splendens TaxID=180675 RepID=UPI001C25531D|nr:shikimate kinase, chloroplastic-like [Salvia splendens]XP_042021646.1 shikimate kinase, chloroplastic-like [Salvia splendens]XP_042021647.1 shikimate kinase, chloroplastic-like [Salvia splendens]XP_042021648.1 shikimate kinase, chloroplastic-like [Salvia splendens]